MAALELSPRTTALLVMDCQQRIVNSLVSGEQEKILTKLPRVIARARGAGIPVIYVVVRFGEGYPEVSARNTTFSGLKQSGRLREGAPDAQIPEALSPLSGEVVVTKKRIGAFTGSDLEEILRSQGIDTLVLTGISSLGVVESTARAAFDKDYRVIVLGDCCSDRDPEANEIALKWVLPRISTVVAASDFEAAV